MRSVLIVGQVSVGKGGRPLNKKIAIAVLTSSIILLGSVPAMASTLNIISGDSFITGTNEVHITPNMIHSSSAPTVTTVITVQTPPTPVAPEVVTAGSSVIDISSLLRSEVSTISVAQPAPVVVPTTGIATSVTPDEQEMIDLINQDRAEHGLPALKVDLRLVTGAREKAQDMKVNQYFGHVSPVFGSTASLFPAMGLNVNYWCENIAGQLTVEAAESALEGDIPHQQNLLDPNINSVGVGIAYNSIYGNLYVQEFARE